MAITETIRHNECPIIDGYIRRVAIFIITVRKMIYGHNEQIQRYVRNDNMAALVFDRCWNQPWLRSDGWFKDLSAPWHCSTALLTQIPTQCRLLDTYKVNHARTTGHPLLYITTITIRPNYN